MPWVVKLRRRRDASLESSAGTGLPARRSSSPETARKRCDPWTWPPSSTLPPSDGSRTSRASWGRADDVHRMMMRSSMMAERLLKLVLLGLRASTSLCDAVCSRNTAIFLHTLRHCCRCLRRSLPPLHHPDVVPETAATRLLPHHAPLAYTTLLRAQPDQLSLAIPPWIGAMSTSERWDVNRHTARCTSPISIVSQCKLVSGWQLRKRRSGSPGRTLRLLYFVHSWDTSEREGHGCTVVLRPGRSMIGGSV